jgi:hypothetical protein
MAFETKVLYLKYLENITPRLKEISWKLKLFFKDLMGKYFTGDYQLCRSHIM